MKKHLLLSMLLAALLSNFFLSCKSLPEIEPVKSTDKIFYNNPFLKEKYQLTHSIKAELPNGDKALLIGLTLIDPSARSINAVIMTVDGGLVLFDVSYKDNTTIINRGMPNFDSSGFAAGLIDDLVLIYFTPGCAELVSGMFEGKFIKRYNCKDRITIDIITNKNMLTEIQKYNKSNSLIRTINFLSVDQLGIPEKFELIAHGLFGYSLYMELINAEKQ